MSATSPLLVSHPTFRAPTAGRMIIRPYRFSAWRGDGLPSPEVQVVRRLQHDATRLSPRVRLHGIDEPRPADAYVLSKVCCNGCRHHHQQFRGYLIRVPCRFFHGRPPQSGIRPCFFMGLNSRLVCRMSSVMARWRLVSAGSMISSTSRRAAAEYGVAKVL